MRILVISDVHANHTALEAVLEDAGRTDEVWCLGDMVGYGPDPNICVEHIRDMPMLTCLLGNHDVAVIGKMPFESFNGDARRSLVWQQQALSLENFNFLSSLPDTAKVRKDVTMAHGSPRDPVWEYIINTLSARLNFDHFDTPWCFVGHSHIQCTFLLEQERDRITLEAPHVSQAVPLTGRAILNPGSVGQPRDRDPRAAYAIYDPDAKTWEARRVEYDFAQVQERIRAASLPERHAMRLAEGW
jgi:predicted phosphodiesterase